MIRYNKQPHRNSPLFNLLPVPLQIVTGPYVTGLLDGHKPSRPPSNLGLFFLRHPMPRILSGNVDLHLLRFRYDRAPLLVLYAQARRMSTPQHLPPSSPQQGLTAGHVCLHTRHPNGHRERDTERIMECKVKNIPRDTFEI